MRDDIWKDPCPICGHEAEWWGKFVMGKWGPLSRPSFKCSNDSEPWHQEIDYLSGKSLLSVVRNESLWTKLSDIEGLIEAKRKAAKNPVHPKTYREEQEKEIIPLEQEKEVLVSKIKTIFKTHCNIKGIVTDKGIRFADNWFPESDLK